MSSYYNFNVLKVNTLAVCFFVFFSVFSTTKTYATDYYITPSGGSNSNSGTSQSAPWATFAHARGQLSAGDTLYLMDGTYTNGTTGTLLWYSSQTAPSGTNGNPITIKALNDGQAFVDGQDEYRPFLMYGEDNNRIHDIDIEGIRFGNSNASCFSIGKADRINVRRVSAFDADYDTNTVVLAVNYSTYVLLEDCAIWGDGRTSVTVYESNNVTVRRCWSDFGTHSGVGGGIWCMSIYGSDNCIIENYISRTSTTESRKPSGINIWANTYNLSASNNKLYGNIVHTSMTTPYWIGSGKYNITGNEFHHNVSIGSKYGFNQRGDDGLVVRNLVVTGTTSGNCYDLDDMHEVYTLEPDFETSETMKNSVLINSASGGLYIDTTGTFGGFTNTYNAYNNNVEANWKGGASQGTGELGDVDPEYDTAIYGDGAYLMYPDALKGLGEGGANIGAEVLYRYEDGALIDERLWPWPMEDRIFAETGISVTWEANGGLWKTLDGVYSAGDNISAPKGLRIQ